MLIVGISITKSVMEKIWKSIWMRDERPPRPTFHNMPTCFRKYITIFHHKCFVVLTTGLFRSSPFYSASDIEWHNPIIVGRWVECRLTSIIAWRLANNLLYLTREKNLVLDLCINEYFITFFGLIQYMTLLPPHFNNMLFSGGCCSG